MGSKNRFAKELLPIILKDRVDGQYYVEPFAGGMNMIDKVTGNRIANDNNTYLIELWKGLTSGEVGVTDISKEYYSQVRDSFNLQDGKFSDFTIGWVGFMGSANGRFFDGGYSGKSNTKVGSVRDYISESIRNISKQVDSMKGVEFYSGNYTDFAIPNNSIVYCDIPYKNTKQYSTSKGFDHDKFWQWVREMSDKGHKVFVSEYSAPDDFECVWEKQTKSSLSANGVSGGSKASTEKLFTVKDRCLSIELGGGM